MNGSPKPLDAAPEALSPTPQSPTTRREAVLARISAAASQANRAADTIQLLAVSKTMDAPHLLAMAQTGQQSFGENYLQEALGKQQWLADHWSGEPLEWHFIGPIQSNKTRPIATHFDWVHTVDRLKIGQRLNEQRPTDAPRLNICLQVNIDDEASKSGCRPDEAVALVSQLAGLPRLRLRGLMAIPRASTDASEQNAAFARVREVFDQCRQALALESPDAVSSFDTLSMGMTGDLEAAVAQGATIVRVGTALFGRRAP